VARGHVSGQVLGEWPGVLSGEGGDITCAHAASSCSIRAHMLLVAMCRAGGVTMLGRHATETKAAHSMAC
jgi:hypothetical protein